MTYKTGLALDDDIWNSHLPAQGGEEHHKLDGVDIMGDDDERCLLGFDEGHNVVETVLGEQRLLGLL